MAQTKETHILMVSLPYHGHINPMIRFAKLLSSKGLRVTLATNEYSRNRFLSTNPNLMEFEFFSDGLDIEVDRDKNLDILLEEYLPREGAKSLSSLISSLEVKVEIPGFPSLKVEDLPTFFLPSSPAHFLNVVSATINTLDRFQWVFGSSFQDIEDSIIHSLAQFNPIFPVGPLVSPKMLQEVYDQEDEEEPCINWLNKQPDSSIIYIALGSISVMSESETKALATILDSDTRKRFLWVRKKPEEGWGKEMGELPEGFLDNTKDRGLVVSWCQQDKVLMHPAICCFLTHCGWNSTLEAIAAGVPIIAYPDWTDQTTNAKLLVDVLKMGVRMRKSEDGELNMEEVERCISNVTEGPNALTFKNQAIKWKAAAKKAISPGGGSNRVIENFISEISGNIA
ncbi:hypothetical protein Cgig2_026235 [Carnegiea gigantea]|uniref:Glycosyltransferase n=1 Tax=Carnegiea gigantea TaxID=171969 RepID=A0A9Q1KIH7_9CARY|nr:hypothetical protein Cgig2_026235 [Carnegiea gigantea]